MPAVLLPLQPPSIPAGGDGPGFYEDGLANRLFEDLLRAGDLVGALEVYARIRGLRPWRAAEVTDERLFAEARSTGAPVHRRVAAIELIGLPPADVMTGLVALARDDAVPEVRAAAMQRLGKLAGTSSDGEWARRKRRLRGTLAGLLRERARGETSPLVRIAMFGAAEAWHIGLPARGPGAVALVARRDGERVLWWVGFAGPARTGSSPRLERNGAPCPFEVERGWSIGQNSGGGRLVSRCGPGAVNLVVTTPRGVVSQPL